MNDIMKIAKSFGKSGWLIKSIKEIIQSEEKEKKGEFLIKLLGILGASILGNPLIGKKVYSIKAHDSIM